MFSLFGKRKKDEEPAAATEPKAVAPIPSPWATEDDEPSSGTAAGAAAAAGGDAGAAAAAVENPGGLNLDALFAPPPADAAPSQPQIGPPDEARTEALKPQIVEALSTIFDPEIPVNIYELGLIYDIIIDAQSIVYIEMTLTSPACPSAQQLPVEVADKVRAVSGVADAIVTIVWEPTWTMDQMSDAARLQLGL